MSKESNYKLVSVRKVSIGDRIAIRTKNNVVSINISNSINDNVSIGKVIDIVKSKINWIECQYHLLVEWYDDQNQQLFKKIRCDSDEVVIVSKK